MWFFRIGFYQRLFISLVLSLSVVLILITISWASSSAKDVYVDYDFEAALDSISNVNPSDRLNKATDAAVEQPNAKFDPSTAVEAGSESVENGKQAFITYMWDSILDQAGLAFIAIAVGVFLTLSTINQYLTEISAGWKRLSIVSSVMISAFIGLYVYFDSLSWSAVENGLQALIFALPLSFMAILYSKAIYFWIIDGFKKDKI